MGVILLWMPMIPLLQHIYHEMCAERTINFAISTIASFPSIAAKITAWGAQPAPASINYLAYIHLRILG